MYLLFIDYGEEGREFVGLFSTKEEMTAEIQYKRKNTFCGGAIRFCYLNINPGTIRDDYHDFDYQEAEDNLKREWDEAV